MAIFCVTMDKLEKSVVDGVMTPAKDASDALKDGDTATHERYKDVAHQVAHDHFGAKCKGWTADQHRKAAHDSLESSTKARYGSPEEIYHSALHSAHRHLAEQKGGTQKSEGEFPTMTKHDLHQALHDLYKSLTEGDLGVELVKSEDLAKAEWAVMHHAKEAEEKGVKFGETHKPLMQAAMKHVKSLATLKNGEENETYDHWKQAQHHNKESKKTEGAQKHFHRAMYEAHISAHHAQRPSYDNDEPGPDDPMWKK